MKKIIYWDDAKCIKCKTKYDLPTLRTRKYYIPGICPKCGGILKTIKEVIK